MNSLFDFITHIKTVEYLIAISAIVVYLIFWEILNPKPFKTLTHSVKEDLEFVKNAGYGNTVKTIGKILTAPFIGLAYIIILPFTFAAALGIAAFNGILSLAGASASFGWKPLESYLGGKKKGKKGETETQKDKNE